ncbi:MAG: NADP-dependent oxidoreductase [Steroidobacteraceae bacterium]
MLCNRQWLLASRPSGAVKHENFTFREAKLVEPELKPGEVFVRNLMFHLAPTMRNWMNEPSRSYRAAVEIGGTIISPGGAEVVKSANPRWHPGQCFTAVSRWEDYSVLEPDLSPTPVIPVAETLTLTEALGVYGMNSLTAYMGVLKVGEPKPGETVVVSAAAGSVGVMAAQIAKLVGCRVIGIAGGRQKCDWLVSTCGLDEAIDYKSENVGARLKELCPNGVNVFFDNVGGEILQAVMDNIAVHGRIAVCGQICAYNSDKPAPGPRDMMRLVYGRVRIQGFVLGDFPNDIEQGRADLMRWVKEGKIVHREDIRMGFENLPNAFLDLFTGRNEGTLLVKIADAA